MTCCGGGAGGGNLGHIQVNFLCITLYTQSDHPSPAYFQLRKGFSGTFTAVPLPQGGRQQTGQQHTEKNSVCSLQAEVFLRGHGQFLPVSIFSNNLLVLERAATSAATNYNVLVLCVCLLFLFRHTHTHIFSPPLFAVSQYETGFHSGCVWFNKLTHI